MSGTLYQKQNFKRLSEICQKKGFKLQIFAADPGEGAGEGGQGNQGTDTDHGKDPASQQEPKPESKTVPKYTDEDLDRIFDKKFAKMMEKHQRELDEAKRLTEMNAQERAEHENKKLQEQVKELLRKEAISEMTKSARAMLNEKNINISDDLLSVLVSEDADKTKRTVESFISLFQDAVNKAVKEAVRGETPKVGGPSKLTKEQIMAVKNRTERQRLIQENMHLFQ